MRFRSCVPLDPSWRPVAFAASLAVVLLAPRLACSQQVPAPQPATPNAGLPKFAAAVAKLGPALPEQATDIDEARVASVKAICREIDGQVGPMLYGPIQNPADWLPRVRALMQAKTDVDERLRRVQELRFALADGSEDPAGRDSIRRFLRVTADLIDLSGRLNFHLRDGVIFTSIASASQSDLRRQLVDEVAAGKSTIGAAMLAQLLIDPPPDAPNRAQPAPRDMKQKIVTMLAQHGDADVLPLMADFIKAEGTPADLAVLGADALIRMGLPQPPDVFDEKDPPPTPPVTPSKLAESLETLSTSRLSAAMQQHRGTLLTWLKDRTARGVTASGYWNGSCLIQPGDWLLVRNSSPYNLFTDLSPGLFTHVGIAALHSGKDGVQRLVVCDLNERQTVIIPKNIETVLPRSLYYAVLRHEDPDVAKAMADTAASMVGNPMKFDLNFDTARVAGYQGKALKGVKIETYCAGILLLCAQETSRPRDEFFPVREAPALGRTPENMKRIGLLIGNDFISPTGPLFARRMKLVHFSQPMFDPRREIEQRIYDHFADGLVSSVIEPKATLFQSLRQKFAEASKTNQFLANAIATAAGVDQETDLASAARAAAVIETLDEIAYDSSDDFHATMRSFRIDPNDEQAKKRFSAEDLARFVKLRALHAGILQKLEKRELNPRDVTETLVAFYIAKGKEQIDRSFFPRGVVTAPAPK